MSIKNVAKGLLPESSNRLMSASFTPRHTRLKHYVIPKDLPPDTLRNQVSPSSSSSNYTLFVPIEATKLVETEYTIENIPHTSIPIISIDSKPNETRDLEREIKISKEVAKNIKGIQTNAKVAEPNKILDSKRDTLINDANTIHTDNTTQGNIEINENMPYIPIRLIQLRKRVESPLMSLSSQPSNVGNLRMQFLLKLEAKRKKRGMLYQ